MGNCGSKTYVCAKITPDSTAADTSASISVVTVTAALPNVTMLPILRAEIVIVTAELAASAVPEMAMIIEVGPGAAGVSVAISVDAVGVTETSKKP